MTLSGVGVLSWIVPVPVAKVALPPESGDTRSEKLSFGSTSPSLCAGTVT